MAITDKAKQYDTKMFPGYVSKFLETDPEFIERFDNFAFDEVVNHDNLDDRTRFMAILAALIGCQGIDEFRAMVPAALNLWMTPVEIKEIVYQAVAYCGIGRVFPFLKVVNEALEVNGVTLPLPSQATTTTENRLEAGVQAQVDIFGDGMREFYKSGPEESRHINHWLAENCFGDYYTRKGLDFKQREMITFCFLLAQGGCEPQLTSHAAANIRLCNDRNFLIKIVSQCLPYIGYPRSLNALRCVNNAAEHQEKQLRKMQNGIYKTRKFRAAVSRFCVGCIKDNRNIFDFALTEEEMQRIKNIDNDIRFFNMSLAEQESHLGQFVPAD